MPRNERARVSVPPPLVTAERCSRPSASPEEEWQRRVLVPFHPQPRAPRHNEHQLLLDLFSRTEQMSRSAGEVKNRSAESRFDHSPFRAPSPAAMHRLTPSPARRPVARGSWQLPPERQATADPFAGGSIGKRVLFKIAQLQTLGTGSAPPHKR